MPGFRPGKVPLQLLKQRYEKSVMGEVLEKTVHEGSHQLLNERNLRPAGQPKVEIVNFEDGKDLEFSVAMEVIPDITPVDFKTLKLRAHRRRRAGHRDRREPAAPGQASAQAGDRVG